MGIEGCFYIFLAGIIILGPIVLSALAISKASSLRRRVNELERLAEMRARRFAELSDRVKQLETGRPTVLTPAPPPSPPVAVPEEPEKEEPILIQPELLAPPRIPPPPPPVKPPEERVPLENVIGERILPRLGVTALVLGLGLLVWYAYSNFGPEGRLALAGGLGAVMVGGGVILRRTLHTELLGGCLIGGGWAVVYTTAYAAHFVRDSKVIENPVVGFLVLFGVAQAALIHALRYRNEMITGIAYLLTVVSLLLSPEPGPPGWLAMGLSGATLVALAWRHQWIRLCAFGAALLYFAEAVWLSKTPPASIAPAMTVLGALWIMWILPDYFHRPATDTTRTIHGLLVGINFGGLLIVAALIRAWFGPTYMGWIWLTLGGLYTAHALLGWKLAWRPAYLAALGFSAVLLGIGTQEQLTGLAPVFAWMGIACLLIAWGVATRDEVPRLLGIAALVVTAARFWMVDRNLPAALPPALVLAALLYGTAALIAALNRKRAAGENEAALVHPLSHIGAIALGLAMWRYPDDWMPGPLFAWIGLTFLALGPRIGARSLIAEGTVYLSIAVFFVAGNLDVAGRVAGISHRIVTTVPVLIAWFLARLIFPTTEPSAPAARGSFGVFLFAGLLGLLGFELGWDAAPSTWALVVATWFVWSRLVNRDFEFILAAAGAGATVFAYIVSPDLRVPGVDWKGPVPTGVIIIGVFLALHLASRREASGRVYATVRDVVAGLMALTGFVLLAREMTGTWLTGSWAMLGFALAAYGFVVRDRVSRWSSLVVLGICLGKVAIFDLATFDMPVKIATLLTLGGVMVALSFVYARHHRRIVVYLAAKE